MPSNPVKMYLQYLRSITQKTETILTFCRYSEVFNHRCLYSPNKIKVPLILQLFVELYQFVCILHKYCAHADENNWPIGLFYKVSQLPSQLRVHQLVRNKA